MENTFSIRDFMQQSPWAVAGISADKRKFGSSAYRELKQRGRALIPVHPVISDFEGDACLKSISDLPPGVNALFLSIKPEKVPAAIDLAMAKGIKHYWLQQGSAGRDVLSALENRGINLIHGKCILMYTDPVGSIHKFHRFLHKITGKLKP